MQSSLLDNFAVVDSHPIDWYDGMVSGLARLRDEPGWFYVSLLAWSQEVDEQVLALLPASDEFANRVLCMLPGDSSGNEEQWQAINAEVLKHRVGYQGKVRLIRCRHFGDPIIALAEIDVDDLGLREQLGRDVQSALHDDEVEKWLGLPGLQLVP